jgi:fluoride ion exporter CrcB/FEX
MIRRIRPPDPAIVGTTMTFMSIDSADMTRRLLDLVFRDASSVLDLTYGDGAFWRPPFPPGITLATNNVDPAAATDYHIDFTEIPCPLPRDSYDVVTYDPPHIGDGGANGIMATRYGTVRGTEGLKRMIMCGAVNAMGIAALGIIVKVTDHSHGGQLLLQSDWIKNALEMQPYAVAYTTRSTFMKDGKHKVQRVPRNNGAVWLAFRKDGHHHRDFERLYARQQPLPPIIFPRRPRNHG